MDAHDADATGEATAELSVKRQGQTSSEQPA
jgi:hypothetical protein